jgi:hypothetical protein
MCVTLGYGQFQQKRPCVYQLKWMAIYFGSAFVIMILLPFPINWAVAIPIFLLISLLRRMLLLRKLDVNYKKNNVVNINNNFKASRISLNQFLPVLQI